MKTLTVFILLFSSLAGAECFRGIANDGSVIGRHRESVLIFQYAGNAGGNGFLAVENKDGGAQVAGETRCSGGAPDVCRFGSDGAIGKFQFVGNRPTIVLDHGKLKVLGGDGDEQDLRAVQSSNSFNYGLEAAEQKVCAELFPQPVEHKRPANLPVQPSVSVPVTR